MISFISTMDDNVIDQRQSARCQALPGLVVSVSGRFHCYPSVQMEDDASDNDQMVLQILSAGLTHHRVRNGDILVGGHILRILSSFPAWAEYHQNRLLEVFMLQSKYERSRIDADPRSSRSFLDDGHLIDPVSGFINFYDYTSFFQPVKLHLHSSTQ